MNKKQYKKYLQSRHWRAFKLRYQASGMPQACLHCGDPKYELHHLTYARTWGERLDDVIPLCGVHHSMVHQAQAKYGIPIKEAERAIRSVLEGRAIPKQRKPGKKPQRRFPEPAYLPTARYCILCSACGHQQWQPGKYCCMCGSLGVVVDDKNDTGPINGQMVASSTPTAEAKAQRQVGVSGLLKAECSPGSGDRVQAGVNSEASWGATGSDVKEVVSGVTAKGGGSKTTQLKT